MLHRLVVGLMLALLVTACGKTREEELKEQHDKGAEAVEDRAALLKGAGDALKKDGKEAAESLSEGIGSVVKGVGSGVDRAQSNFKVGVSDSARARSLGVTRIVISDNAATGGKAVKVYVTSDKPFKGRLQLRAFDAGNIEIGRSGKVDGNFDPDDALYIEFLFDQATPITRVNSFLLYAL